MKVYKVTNPLPHNQKFLNKIGESPDDEQLIKLVTFLGGICEFFRDSELSVEKEYLEGGARDYFQGVPHRF